MYNKVLIVEHPKCGRHWLENLLMYSGNIGTSLSHAGSAAIRRKDKNPMTPIQYFNSIGPKTGWKRKKIFLYRNPKDVMVSFYYQVKYRCHPTKVNLLLAKDISTFIRSKYGIEYLLKFYQLWENFTDEFGIMFLSYENLHEDTFSSIKRVLEFVEHEINEEKIKFSIEFNNFENTRKREEERHPNWNKSKYHTREGKVKGYKNYMNEDDINYCNEMMEKYPSRLL